MRLIRSLVIAFSTYSRIPMPQVEWSNENRRYSMCFFPLVGALIGGFIWLWLFACDRIGLNPFIRGAVGSVIPLLVSGGIHMDGFMDTSDAIASWQPKEKKLEILKDSHTGAFAVMGCAAYMLLFASVLSGLSAREGLAAGLVFVASRALSAWFVAFLKSARPDGMLDKFAQSAVRRAVTVSGIIYLSACIVFWAVFCGWLSPLLALAAVLFTLYYRHMAYKQFGGVTGDLAGWFLQLTELILLAVISIGGMIL